jgi:hypothetical protein
VLDRQAFRKLNEKDRKLLYKQYGFSDSDNEDQPPLKSPKQQSAALTPVIKEEESYHTLN